MNKLYIFSPLSQFEVTNLIGINAPILGNLHIDLTNLSLYSIFVVLIIVGLHVFGDNDNKIIPNKWSISFESSYASLNTMVRDQINTNNEKYFPFIYSIFFYILIYIFIIKACIFGMPTFLFCFMLELHKKVSYLN